MDADPLEQDVKQFISQYHAIRIERLLLTSRLLHDLGVDGADGWEFMEAFGKQFGVDVRDFQAGLHFGSEAGCDPVVFLFVLLFHRKSLGKIPITVGDLVEAARSKQWCTPARNPA